MLVICPSLGSVPTGGTLYNRAIVRLLVRAGVELEVSTLDEAWPRLKAGAFSRVLVDGLYLEVVPAVVRRVQPTPVGWVAHAWPSWLASARAIAAGSPSPVRIEPDERRAMDAAQVVIATSPRAAEVLRASGVTSPVFCVEPGVSPRLVRTPREENVGPSVVVAHVVENKAILPFLRALSREGFGAEPEDGCLEIVGSLALEPDYAARCQAYVREAFCAGAVVFVGERTPEEARRHLARARLLVSPSPMESYGMALAEARAEGVPIVARRGGHVVAHVEPSAGGRLVDDERELACALVSLLRDRRELERATTLAARGRRRRPWSQAAREWIALCTGEAGGPGGGSPRTRG